ncbi:MAG: molybdopterin-dependent oxidoreductase, partial [Candidatus Binatia bacterium]
LLDGTYVDVEPVYERLRRDLDARYTPEQASEISGVGADLIRRVAREIAEAGASMIFASVGTCKHYHADLMHRSMILLMALTGNQGRSGGGLRFGSWWGVTGFEELAQAFRPSWWQDLLLKFLGRPPVRDVEEYIGKFSRSRTFTPLLPWLYVHSGYGEKMAEPSYNDDANPLSVDASLEIALEKDWLPVYPAPGKDPKVFLISSSNPLRRWPAPQLSLKHLWPKLDLIVNENTHMSTTGMYSDVLLPAAGFYEKEGIQYAWSFLPYIVLDDKAVEPLGESRNEWWIFGEIARRVQREAIARGTATVKDALGQELDLKKAFDVWSDGGVFDPSDQSSAMDFILERSEVCDGKSWDSAIKRGVIPIRRNGRYSAINAICSDVDPERPLYPHAWQTEGKESWPTLTGRQQFYLDQDWYVAAGEALPVHKDPPAAGGDYPLRLTGGHTRWSIHAIWRSSELMQRLQRGEPVLYMNDGDALERAIDDNDYVRVFNDIGEFKCRAKPSAAVQRNQAIIYHAWEPFQFAGHEGQQNPVISPWKALHVAGDYGQLHYRFSYGAPNFGPRGTTVQIERA